MNVLWNLVIFVIIFKIENGLSYNFVDTKQYYQMPPLYKYDDYEECNGKFDNSPYCIVNTYIKPDHSSNLYNFIRNFSSSVKQHYRHDKLQRGICLEMCRELIVGLGNETDSYYVDQFPMDSKLIYDFIHYYKVKQYRDRYNKLLNKCVNIDLMRRYNLTGYSTIEYCVEKGTSIPFDSLDVVFVCLFFLVITTAISSSLYDRYLKNSKDKKTDEHYKIEPSSQCQKLLVIFSIRRNWHHLTAETKSDFRELRFLGAIRTLTLFGVIIGHCAWYSNFIPSTNPIFIEDMFRKIESMLVINGLHIVQTFFGISGFLNSLITLSYLDRQGKKQGGVFLLFKSIVVRYVRLAPLVAAFVLFHGTWMYRFNDGPFWTRVSEPERQFCRDNWWQNLLFVNNYLNGDERCLIHTWYLAADFHLSILGTLVLILILRQPKLKHFVFSLILGFSVFICGYVTYVNKLEPLTIFPPETLRNQLLTSSDTEKSYFDLYYAPTHTNMGTYFVGLAVGFYYFYFKKNNQEVKQSVTGRIIWYFGVITGFSTILSAYIFYEFDFQKPSIWIALLSTVLKHMWAVALSTVGIGFLFKYGWFIPNIFNYPMFRILGRISFSAYMVHLFLIKLIMGGSHYTLNLSVSLILSYCVAVLFVSNIVGLILSLVLDVPINSLCKIIFGEKTGMKPETLPSHNHNDNNENHANV